MNLRGKEGDWEKINQRIYMHTYIIVDRDNSAVGTGWEAWSEGD